MSELSLTEALSEVGKWGRIVKGFEKVAEVTAALSGAEQLIAERQAQADALLPVIEDRTAAAAMAATAAEDALAQRDAILAAAQGKAATIISAAEDKARHTQSEAEAAAAAAQDELAAVRDDLASKRAQLVTAQAELDAVLVRTAAAREAARKLIAEG